MQFEGAVLQRAHPPDSTRQALHAYPLPWLSLRCAGLSPVGSTSAWNGLSDLRR